jgi:HlyD family secretion protein
MDRREIDAQVDAAAAAVNVAHAALESREATLDNALVEHERSQRLLEAGAIPRQRLDETQTSRRAATAQTRPREGERGAAEAALRRARETQRDTILTSPIDGVIVERNYDAEPRRAGRQPIVAVADLRSLKLEAGVSELEAGPAANRHARAIHRAGTTG